MKKCKAGGWAVGALFFFLGVFASVGPSNAENIGSKDTWGTEFILAIPPGFKGAGLPAIIIEAKDAAQGIVEIPGLGISKPFSVAAGGVADVLLPYTAVRIPKNTVSNYGIRVSSDTPVHVKGFNYDDYNGSIDGFLGIPVDALGNDYRVINYYMAGTPVHMTIVGVEDGTEVTITPSADMFGRKAGETFTIALNRLQTFHVSDYAVDYTGTIIKSSAPIAVFGGAECAYVPRDYPTCDYLVEMLPPVETWGNSFVTYPLGVRPKGDLVRVLAAEDGTDVRINGDVVATLNAGGYFDTMVLDPAVVETNHPVLVAQYATGMYYDSSPGDPFMMLVTPSNSFLDHYIFASPSRRILDGTHYINVVVPASAVSTVQLDGSSVAEQFHLVGDGSYAGANIVVNGGDYSNSAPHTITANEPFGLYVYGFARFRSYGYPGGISLEAPRVVNGDYRNVRVVSTLATNGITLDTSSFTVPPARIDQLTDRTEIEWKLDEFSIGQVQNLEYELVASDLLPGESRLVSQSVELVYQDRNGNTHRRLLGEQLVAVEQSLYNLNISLDKGSYLGGESAIISTEVTNRGTTDTLLGIEIDVRDSVGRTVAVLPTIDNIAAVGGAQIALAPGLFDTAGLYAGSYRVYARLLTPDGQATMAYSDFTISVPTGTGFTATVTADKQTYLPLEDVVLTGRLRNTAPNVQFTAETVQLRVIDPSGALFWKQQTVSRTLAPGSLDDIVYAFPLGAATAGTYRVELEANDGSGTPLVFAATDFSVLSSSTTGAGMSGNITTAGDPIFRTEALDLVGNITNSGNDAFLGLPVTLTLLNPETQEKIVGWSETVDLAKGASHALSARWMADEPGGTVLVAVLSAEMNGAVRTLAHSTIHIEEKFVSTPAIDGHGRLLVLLDPARGPDCKKVEAVHLALDPEITMTTQDLVEVRLYGVDGTLLDAESIGNGSSLPVDLSSGYQSNLVLSEHSSNGVGIDLIAVGPTTGLPDKHRVVAVVHSGGVINTFDSGPISTSCNSYPAGSEVFGEFRITGVDVLPDIAWMRQRTFLEQLLKANDWSYSIVTDRDAFTREMRSGSYSAYLLLAANVHLDVQVQRELREAVYSGAGILMGSAHDQRNSHLFEIFGAELTGVSPRAIGIAPITTVPLDTPNATFTSDERPLLIRLRNATALSTYTLDTGAVSNSTAVATQTFGSGRSVLAGFDILNEAEAAGMQGPLASFLPASLDYVHADKISLRPNIAVPMLLNVSNRGEAAAIRVVVNTVNGTIADPGMASLETATSLMYLMDLPARSERGLRFWWKMPDSGMAFLFERVDMESGNTFTEYGATLHALAVEYLPTFNDVKAEIEPLVGQHNHYANALAEVEQSELADTLGDPAKSIFHLLQAADWLMSIGGDQANNIHVTTALLIRRLEQKL